MTRAKSKRRTPEEELRDLASVADDPSSQTSRARVVAALESRRSHVVARAARLVREHGLTDLDAELKTAFERFLEDPVKRDPSCTAKLAILEALDYGESTDEELFLRAARYVQKEPAWGPPVDTAVALRGRGVVALARTSYPELGLLAAAMLTDPEPPVRGAACDALAHRGDAALAALMLFKIRIGDDDPLVTMAAMNALISLAPTQGIAEIAPMLSDGEEEHLEIAAMVLGQSRHSDALDALLDALARCVRRPERHLLLRGLGLHRTERALEATLRVVAEGAPEDAKAAVAALGVRRFDPGVEARVRQAADRNEEAELTEVLEQVFAP